MRLFKKNFKIKLLNLLIIFLLVTVSIFNNGYSKESYTKDRKEVYCSYNQLTDLLQLLQDMYPEIFLFYSLGKTYENRDIWCVKISDNVTIDEDEAGVLFTGGVHGNEKPGYQTVIYSIKAIVENYTAINVNQSFTNRIRNIVNNTELYFIPMVNPDGCEASTRKNRRPNPCIFGNTLYRGVDINRNFDYNWDDVDKHPLRYIFIPRSLEDLKILFGKQTTFLFERSTVKHPLFDFLSPFGMGIYRGPHPFSENESQALKKFVENHSIIISLDYHICGEVILYSQPWEYRIPSDEKIFRFIAENITKINGYDIRIKPEWRNSSGGYKYWSYLTHGVFAFTVELCASGKPVYFPNEKELLELYRTHLNVNLYISEKALTIKD